MKAIILSAGQGSRLSPLTIDRPKCLVEIDGLSLLDRQISVLRSCGVEEIILVGGYLGKKLENKAQKVIVNYEYASTNMVYTILCSSELNGNVLVSYGDIVYSAKLLKQVLNSASDISVAVDMEWENYWRTRNENFLADAETLKLGNGNKIYEIGKKPKSLKEVDGQYIGLTKYSPKGIQTISNVYNQLKQSDSNGQKQYRQMYMTDLLQSVIEAGFEVNAVRVSEPWIEVDTVKDLSLDITRQRALFISEELSRSENIL